MTKYSLFQFNDGRKLKILCLTSDIQGFTPTCAEDIPNREFLCKWQESFHDENVDHSGSYPGRVLIIGATPDEVRAKAKELKIRLPLSFPAPDDGNKKEPMRTPLKRSHRKLTADEDPEVLARKQRMVETAKLIGVVEEGKPKEGKHHSNDRSRSVSAKTAAIGDKDAPDKTNKSKHRRKTESRSRSRSQSSGVKSAGGSNATNTIATRSQTSEKFHEDNPRHEHSNSSHGCSSPAFMESTGASDYTVTDVQSQASSEIPCKVNAEGDKQGSDSFIGSTSKSRSSASTDDSIRSYITASQSHAISEKSVKDKLGGDKESDSASEPRISSSHEFIPQGGISKRKCTKGVSYDCGGETASNFSSDDPDDATVQLEKLKKDFSRAKLEIEQLQEKVEKQRSDLKLYKYEITLKREMISKLKQENEKLEAVHQKTISRLELENKDLMAMNLNLQRQQLLVSKPKVKQEGGSAFLRSSPQSKPSPAYRSSSYSFKPSSQLRSPVSGSIQSPPVSSHKKTSSSSPVEKNISSIKKVLNFGSENDTNENSDEFHSDKEEKEIPMSIKSSKATVLSPFKKTSENEEEAEETKLDKKDKGNKAKYEDIAQRICMDLKGVTPLASENDEVHIGMGFKMNKASWEKVLRKRKDDSRFFKDCAGVLWGREALKQRTAQRSTSSGKKPCTPRKVRVLHAMLRGKMMARGESEQQREFVLTNMAPKWLTEKCYDVSRPPRPPAAKK